MNPNLKNKIDALHRADQIEYERAAKLALEATAQTNTRGGEVMPDLVGRWIAAQQKRRKNR
jgi:hypothetical protein